MRIVLFAAIVSLLASCTIEERIHFDKDFTGQYEMSADLSMMAEFGESMDEGSEEGDEIEEVESEDDKMFTDEEMKEMKEEFEKIDGVSNFSASEEENRYIFNFDFENVDVFDELPSQSEWMDEETETKDSDYKRFVQSGKTLIINFEEEESGEMDEEGMEEMMAMFQFRSVMVFDAPIKKIKSKIATHDESSNEVIFEYTAADAMKKGGKNWQTKIYFE